MHFCFRYPEVTLMAAPCGCSRACSCRVSQNGAVIIGEPEFGFSNFDVFESERIGWRDNLVEGTGSANNPYMVSFKDSLEFRPRAQEWRQTGVDFFANGWINNDPTVYSTPHPFATFLWSPAFPSDINGTATGYLVGAWASFTVGVAPIEMIIVSSIADATGPFNIAAASTQTANPVLACSGYVNPMDSSISLASSGITATLVLQIFDPSNSNPVINDVRVWAVEV